jgi:urease accessory protein
MKQARRTAPCLAAAQRAALLLALLAPTAALAHPGHGGGFLPGLLHPLQGPDHLLAAVAVGAWGAKLGGRAAWALPAAFVAAMLAGSVVGHAGIALPGAEIVIAFSVLLLGIVLTANARVTAAAGAALVALFALFHGGAHAAEAPAQGSAAVYTLGLCLATLVLHSGGVAAALALQARPWLLRLAAAPIALVGAGLLASRLG